MDATIQEFQFLDLENINEKDRNHLHRVLFSQPPGKSPEFPWLNNEENCTIKGWTSPTYVVNGPPDLVMPVVDQEIPELSSQYAGQPTIPITHIPQGPGYAPNPESPSHAMVVPPPHSTSVPPPSAGPAPMFSATQLVTPLSNVSSVYVSNVTANVSLHPYPTMPPPPSSYHHHHHHNRHQSPLGSPHYPVDVDPNGPVEGSGSSSHRSSIGSQGSDRPRRGRGKGKRDDRHNIPSPESMPPVQQTYIHAPPHAQLFTYGPYTYYTPHQPPPAQSNVAAAQSVTGTPLYLTAPPMQMYAPGALYGTYVPAPHPHPHHHHHQSPTQQELQSQPQEHFQQPEDQVVIEHEINSPPVQQHYSEVNIHCQEQGEREPVVKMKIETMYEHQGSTEPEVKITEVEPEAEKTPMRVVPSTVTDVVKTEHGLRTQSIQQSSNSECHISQQTHVESSLPVVSPSQTQTVPVMVRTVQTTIEQENAPVPVPEESAPVKVAPPVTPVDVSTDVTTPRTSMSPPATSPTFPAETSTSSPDTSPSVPAPAPAPVQESGRSWASLFKDKQSSTLSLHSSPVVAPGEGIQGQKPLARVGPFSSAPVDDAGSTVPSLGQLPRTSSMIDDPVLYRLGEHLQNYELEYTMTPLQPRGLTNRSNWCYVNATLQALLACPPFYNLLRSLPLSDRTNSTKSSTPIIGAMVELVKEFESLAPTFLGLFGRNPRREKMQRARAGAVDDPMGAAGSSSNAMLDVPCGPPFEPSYIYRMMNGIRGGDAFKVEGRQEDAEEFLGCLLNGLNDEMLELMKLVEDTSKPQGLTNGEVVPVDPVSPVPEPDIADGNEWKVMGPKNKGSVTRRAEFERTPLSDIFRGQLRSRVQRMGDTSTDNVQPFFTLQLDIEKAQSVKDAMELLVGKDQLEGLTCLKTHREVEAWQQVTIEELPPVLILHLKWFDYKLDGCSKIVKSVEFTVDLKVDGKLMSSNKAKYGVKQKQYKLFAVVYHDGNEATKGHYITDAYHQGLGGWIRYDDSSVRSIPETAVLKPKAPRVPYLLYYRRADTIGGRGALASASSTSSSEKPR